MGECFKCEHGRKAGHSDKVACNALSRWKHGYAPPIKAVQSCPCCGEIIREQVPFEEYFANLEFKNNEGVYEGWAYLGARPEGEKGGLMFNFCIILDKDNCCENFKERD